ncbi:MAG: 2-polyprenyl-3-methyl-5-hydroxy-6-metoxy-1,4-benzoquinol methylase [Planctomycetota bacterium]|jgi:2-polyprenyl-3-methyl-5-hydroxy-6-metoxy-1,4-benzoquinol methylase
MSLYDSQVGILYQITDQKPDKKYSILPTVMSLLGDISDKTVVDLGGGTGFFSHHIARLQPKMIIGIDNSVLKIGLAGSREKLPNVLHALGDVFFHDIPNSDIVLGAFVINYAEHVVQLENLLRRVFKSLNLEGRFIGVVDLPSGKDLTAFGAKKQLSEQKDGAKMFIHLYNEDGNSTCTLEANYFLRETYESIAKKVGFTSFSWKKPVISDEGRDRYPDMDWESYVSDPELGYFIATK